MKRRLLFVLLAATFWSSAVQATPARQEMEPVVLYFFGERDAHIVLRPNHSWPNWSSGIQA